MRSVVAVLLLVAGCAAPTPGPSQAPPAVVEPSAPGPSPQPSGSQRQEEPTADPAVRRIPDRQWSAMRAAGVVRPGCPLTRADLRRVEVNFHAWGGGVRRGVLVVNRDVARDVAAIFTDIFDAGFPIRSIRPIEEFGGDDNASMAADNTSAYNCRTADQANAAAADSPHANGRAVDINPRENPWWDPRCQCFMPTAKYAERARGKGKILEGGPVWRAFTKRGWIWQDIATPDYQHFDTGYPSRPWPG